MPSETTGRSIRDRLAERFHISKTLTLVAILLVLLVNALDMVVPPLGIPLTLLFIWLLLWLTRGRWSDLGMRRPKHWGAAIGLGVGTALLLQALGWFVLLPLLEWFGAELPDYTRFEALRGNLSMLLLYLTVSWTTAGFGEEIIVRGFLMNHVARLMGGGRTGWVLSLIGVSILFGLGHIYQGPTGVVMTGSAGLVFGVLYLACGRNLWPPIIAHGTTDTLSFLIIYLGLWESVAS